jgi:hypothetical protein
MRSLLPTDRRRPRHDQVWLWLVATLLLLPVSASSVLAQGAADSTGSRLAASSAPPWNPPEGVESSRAWEKVVRTPGWLVSLPFSALGR